MAEWQIKEVSDLTKTSIRMLRHYDKIGLLKPSFRRSNGYRCYTEQDLARLQQIIALRYFGFSLRSIKSILQKHTNIYAHLQAQQLVVRDQALHLQKVNGALDDILKRLSPSKTPDWNDLINLIEGYRMTEDLRQKLKKTWAGKLSESQFEAYLDLYEKFPKELEERDRLIDQINNKELGDPEGPDGERVVRFIHDLARQMRDYYSDQLKLGAEILESLKSGKLSDIGLTQEGALWISRATLSYWLKRWDALYEEILANLKSDPRGKAGKKITKEWTGILNDLFSAGSRTFAIGVMVWQDLAKQDHKLKETNSVPAPQEMLKPYHIKLFFNAEAVSWVSRALEAHESSS